MRNRSEVMGKPLEARVGRFTIGVARIANPMLSSTPKVFLSFVGRSDAGGAFEDLAILCNGHHGFRDRCEAIFFIGTRSRRRFAGSMAIRGLISRRGERARVDRRGAVKPSAYDLLFGSADIVVGDDVTFGGAPERRRRRPSRHVLRGEKIMQGDHRAEAELRAPDILVSRPSDGEAVRVLDFFRAAQSCGDGSRPRPRAEKRALSRLLEASVGP